MENNRSSSSSSLMVEITVLSAENLRVKGRPIKKNAFAIVRADAFNSHFTKKDAVRGSYPLWDEKFVMHLPMPMHTSSIDLQVKYKTSSGRAADRLVGTASLPVSDFIGEYLLENHVHFMSYVLRDEKEKRSGIVNLSVKVKLSQDASSFHEVAIGIPV